VEVFGNPEELIASGHIDNRLSSTIAEDPANVQPTVSQVSYLQI